MSSPLSPFINKITTACEITELLEKIHIQKHFSKKELSKEEIIQIRRNWYLDKLNKPYGEDFGIPSSRII